MERAIIFTLRLLNSAASFAARPSSVVHTGVKSRGWENRMPHLEGEGRSWCEGGCHSGLCCRQKAVQIAWRGVQEQLVSLIRKSCPGNSSFPITRNLHEMSPALRNSLHLTAHSLSRILQEMLEQPVVLDMEVDTVPCEEVWGSHVYTVARDPTCEGMQMPTCQPSYCRDGH